LITCSAVVLLGVFVSHLADIGDSMSYPQHSANA
jgi:hypothetical protein